ncbi:LPS assembly lipoprotein LptE [Sphingomonas donggukensis]|uniref:LPS assembly lipoprotein LptE n=1 Tax=Sphingomonas donggukensis TaxID=2949093 RepID=A0ABY4TUA1_9SPHN|nr:LPS assembly lipoprotein LptE [Sphingomonas donggukensis]URW75286.1 LPS assembly lipoprotein LptE [Sphingomonas donggukensis]
MIRLAAPLALMLLLSACGLRPLYGGVNSPARATLGAVQVAPIEGQAGYLVATALRDRLAAGDAAAPRYRLDVRLDDRITGLGVRRDDSISRERRTLRARYQLVDLARGTTLLDATAGSDAGVDVVGSEYATIAAEQTALERLSGIIADQIVARLALYADRAAEAAPTATP